MIDPYLNVQRITTDEPTAVGCQIGPRGRAGVGGVEHLQRAHGKRARQHRAAADRRKAKPAGARNQGRDAGAFLFSLGGLDDVQDPWA